MRKRSKKIVREANIIKSLLDEKLVKILEVLTKNPSKDYHLSELAKEAGVPTASTYRILESLYKLEVVEIIRLNKFKVYKLNSNDKNKALHSIFEEKIDPIRQFLEEVRQITEVEQVIQHGDQSEKETNLLLIGNKIDSTKIDNIVNKIKAETSHEISFVSIDEAQYQKMTKMGLYSGKKDILFSS